MTLKKLTKEEAQERLAIIESSGVLPQEVFASLKILADSVIDSGGTTEDVLAAFNALVPAETNDENLLDAIDAIRVSYPNRDRPLADYPEIEERVRVAIERFEPLSTIDPEMRLELGGDWNDDIVVGFAYGSIYLRFSISDVITHAWVNELQNSFALCVGTTPFEVELIEERYKLCKSRNWTTEGF